MAEAAALSLDFIRASLLPQAVGGAGGVAAEDWVSTARRRLAGDVGGVYRVLECSADVSSALGVETYAPDSPAPSPKL